MSLGLRNTVKAVALLEGLKGLIVITAGLDAFSLIHKNVQLFAEHLVAYLHLNPAKGFPRIFIDYSAHLNSSRLAALSALAIMYATGRLIESYGLWNNRAWAEWFAIVSAGIYIPFELYEMMAGTRDLAVVALVVNVGVVAIMIVALRQRRRAVVMTQSNQ
jgi:uncharacterized membrane protein (DUF2068 family)